MDMDNMVCSLKQDSEGFEKLLWDVYSLNTGDGEIYPFSSKLIVPFGLHMFTSLENPIKTVTQSDCVSDSMLKSLMKMTHYDDDDDVSDDDEVSDDNDDVSDDDVEVDESIADADEPKIEELAEKVKQMTRKRKKKSYNSRTRKSRK